MTEVRINLGQCFTVTDVPTKYVFSWPTDQAYRRGHIINKGSKRVILGWNKVPDSFDDTDEADKAYIDSSDAPLRVPHKCNYFVAGVDGASSSSSSVPGSSNESKCIIVED